MPNVFFIVGNKTRAVASIRRTADGQPQSLYASIADGGTVGLHPFLLHLAPHLLTIRSQLDPAIAVCSQQGVALLHLQRLG